MAKLSDRRAPSSKQLQQIKDVTSEMAEEARAIWKTVPLRDEARKQIDKLIRTCGVEFLGVHRRTGDDVYYCNAGDPYATTILFRGLSLIVGCMADLVESNLIKEPQP